MAITGLRSTAQSPVTIPIETEKNALVLQTDKDNRLIIVYYGTKLSSKSEYETLKKQAFSIQLIPRPVLLIWWSPPCR